MFNFRIEPSQRLRRAVNSNDALLVQRILRSHPDLLHNPDHSSTGLSNSSLHLAASLGHLQICKILVALGHEDPTPALNENHQTALMLAAAAGHTEVVHFLAENDPPSILRPDVRGRDAIMEASLGGHDTVLQILLTYVPGGAQGAVQSADIDGNTALHFASSNGNLLVLRTLLAAGADAEKRNVWSWTAVAYSATVQAEVYLKGLVADVQRRRRAKSEAEDGRKGGAVRVVEELDSQQAQTDTNTADLPYPATKLVIGQHFWSHPSGCSWAWLVVGSFYDSKDREIYHIEVFLGCIDENDSESYRVSVTDTTTPATSSTARNNSNNDDIIYQELDSNFEVDNDNSANLHQVILEPWELDVELICGIPSHDSEYPRTNLPQAMAGQSFGRGWNPQFGWDTTVNPTARPAFGNPIPGGMPYGQFGGHGGFGYMMKQGAYNYPGMQAMPGGMMGQQQFPMAGLPNGQGPTYVLPQGGYQQPVPVFPGQHARFPQPHPVVNAEAPALNLTNSTGGAGAEPGYNYFFSPEHTKIHVIKSSTPPWRVPAGMSMHFGAYHVPANNTIAELMKGFGASNPVPKKNKITEVISGGNGKWYKGVTFSGDEKDDMSKVLKDLGWDGTRTGKAGEKPVVWLWITKD